MALKAFSLLGIALFTLTSAAPVLAQNVFFPNDATINSFINGNAVVGFANQNDLDNRANPTSPTVNLVDGGVINSLFFAFNSSAINVTGGAVVIDTFANDSSVFNISGGNLQNALFGRGNSIVNQTGGRIAFPSAGDNSVFNISGGLVGNNIEVLGNGVVNLSGGEVPLGFTMVESGLLNFSGGNVQGNLFLDDNSVLCFLGSNFTSSLLDANAQGGLFSQFAVSGTLADGTLFNTTLLFVENGSDARFLFKPVAVPEPGGLALLGGIALSIGGSLLRRRK